MKSFSFGSLNDFCSQLITKKKWFECFHLFPIVSIMPCFLLASTIRLWGFCPPCTQYKCLEFTLQLLLPHSSTISLPLSPLPQLTCHFTSHVSSCRRLLKLPKVTLWGPELWQLPLSLKGLLLRQQRQKRLPWIYTAPCFFFFPYLNYPER